MLCLEELGALGEVLDLIFQGLDVQAGALEEDRLGAPLIRAWQDAAKPLKAQAQVVTAALPSARRPVSAHLLALDACRPRIDPRLGRALVVGRRVVAMVRVAVVGLNAGLLLAR